MDARSIAVVMITVDRSPKRNYLADTLDNLRRAGTFSSVLLHSFHLCNSNGDRSHLPIMLLHRIHYRMAVHRDYIACENAGRALKIGAESGAPWVLFCEDDIDVCANFLESIAAWLDTNAIDPFHLFSFASPYPHLRQWHESGNRSWVCPPQGFYGTQCFAVSAEDASRIGTFLLEGKQRRTFQRSPTEYDLMIGDWLLDNYGPESILCSAPSFVEHIGIESACNPRPNIHRSPSWPGREWSYA